MELTDEELNTPFWSADYCTPLAGQANWESQEDETVDYMSTSVGHANRGPTGLPRQKGMQTRIT